MGQLLNLSNGTTKTIKTMKTTFRTKHGTEVIGYNMGINRSGPVYRSLVDFFDDFINYPNNEELREMYFGSFEELHGGSYLCWKSAVDECYHALLDHLYENKIKSATSRLFNQIDLVGILQA